MSEKVFEEACLCSLFHDLQLARICLMHHVQNPYNPYSIQFKDDLKLVADSIHLLYKHIDSVVNHV